MNQLIPSLAVLPVGLAPAFRQEVYALFGQMVGAWIVCLGRRSINRVWETTGQAEQRNHAAAFRLFSQAAWNWDEVCRLLQVLATLVPGLRVWLVVDDRLCHKRGAKVAFGGIFLDAVLSTKRHKVFRFGNNWVLLGVVIELPFRANRYFCLPLVWRVYEKRGTKAKKDHRTKSQLAAEMIALVAGWFPQRHFLVVADSAYMGKHLLKKRPANVEALGPICWKAALYEAVAQPVRGRRHGERWPTPAALLRAEDPRWPAQTLSIPFKNGCTRQLEVKVITGVCWDTVAGSAAVQVVLVRDPKGEWRNEALVCTDVTLTPGEVITGYCRRWSVETYFKLLKGASQQVEHWQQENGLAVLKRLLVASMACVLVWRLARSPAPPAAEAREWLVRLSGRQLEWGKSFTQEALLAGLWVLLAMREVLELISPRRLRDLADFILSGSVSPDTG
jgi:hypothetical protein